MQRTCTYGAYIDEPITMTASGTTCCCHTNNMYRGEFFGIGPDLFRPTRSVCSPWKGAELT